MGVISRVKMIFHRHEQIVEIKFLEKKLLIQVKLQTSTIFFLYISSVFKFLYSLSLNIFHTHLHITLVDYQLEYNL